MVVRGLFGVGWAVGGFIQLLIGWLAGWLACWLGKPRALAFFVGRLSVLMLRLVDRLVAGLLAA